MRLVLYLGIIILLVHWPFVVGQDKDTDITPLSQEQKNEIEHYLKGLKNWPLTPGQQAAEFLIAKGKIAVPFLLLAIKEGELQTRIGSAYCLGKLKVAEAFPLLWEMAKDRKMLPHLATIFAAMMQCDSQHAYPALLEFLQSTVQTGHYPAFQVLSSVTGTEHLPLLAALLESKQTEARKYTLQLIAQLDSEAGQNLLIQALGDSTPAVALQSAALLGSKDLPTAQKKLLELSTHSNKRLRGYAAMALVWQEDKFQKALFDDSWSAEMVAALRHDDYFVRGTAAIAVANIAFRTDKKELITLMDTHLVPILIETIAGKVYFKEYMALRPLAYQKLTQLTGMDLGSRADEWWGWWHTYSNRFHAIRLLKGVSQEDLRDLALEYKQEGGMDSTHFLILASARKAKNLDKKANRRTVVLDDDQAAQFLDLLQNLHIFDLQPQYGEVQGVKHAVELTIQNFVKKITVYGQNAGPLAPLTAEILKLARRNNWQLYWDNDKNPDWEKWFAQEAEWFRTTQDEIVRMRRLKQMILAAYGWLPLSQRNGAAEEFLLLMEKDSWLPAASIELALLHIHSEAEMSGRTELLVRALALTQDTLAINPLITLLLRNYSLQTRKWMSQMLLQAEKVLVLQYLRHPNAHLRGVAAEVLGKRPADEMVVLYLVGMLKDESLEVRQCAASALGDLKPQIAWEPLRKLVENKDEHIQVRQSALLALPKISKEAALPILLERLQENDLAIRHSAIQAIGEIGGKVAIQTLLAILRGDPSRETRQIALNSLIHIKDPQVAEALVQMALQPGSVESRILTLQGLSYLQAQGIGGKLVKLLEDREEEVRIQAALTLANYQEKKAIPALIQAVSNRRYGLLARKELEKLTLVSFSDKEDMAAQARYSDWWRTYGELSPRQWFFDALQAKGYNVTPLLDYLLGSTELGCVPVLLQALEDRDWFIRAAACQTLQELTGKSFGTIEPYTGKQTTQKILRDWQAWHQEHTKGK